jgi:hypothetical protein
VEHLFRDDARKARKRKKTAKATLSFAMDDEGDDENGEVNGGSSTPNGEDDDHPVLKRSKLKKNPNVDTSFLPDRDREEAERKERERLRLEWLAKQESIKKEEIEIVYSYWDGSGHRKSVMVSGSCILIREISLTLYSEQCKKGDEIGSFLEKCRAQFPELRGVSVDNLMYVKVCRLNHEKCCLVNTGYWNSRKTLLYLMYDLSWNALVFSLTFPASITLFMTSSSTKREGSPDLYSTLMFTTTCDCWRMQQRRKMNPMQGRLWNGVITREISISSLHLAGRFATHLLSSTKASNHPFRRFLTRKKITENIPSHNLRLVVINSREIIHLAILIRRKRK